MPRRSGVLPLCVVSALLLLTACGEGLEPMADDAQQPLDPVAGDAEQPEQPLDPVAGDAEQPEEIQQELTGRYFLRPDGTVQSGWLTGGSGSAWEKLDESVTQPTPVLTIDDHLWAGGADRITEVTLQNPTNYRGDPGEVTAWFYGNTGSSTQVRVDVVSGSQVRATVIVPAMSGFAWRSIRFNVGQLLELDDVRLRFRALGGPDANIRAAYMEVTALSTYAVLGSAVKVRPHELPTGSHRASIFAARNEFESFQVVVKAPNAPVRALRASFSVPLTGPGGAVIPSRNVTVYREGYYNVTTPSDLEGAVGRWPDPLIPAVDPLLGQTRNAFPVDVPVGENRTLWVDIQVPIDAAAGVYRGNLKLTAEDMSMDIPVELKVLNFTLPSTTTLKSSYGFTPGMECKLGTPNCETDLSARARAKQLFVRSALDNRITTARAHATNLRTGSTTGIQEFRTYTLPFIRGTAPTRLPGAKLTTYQVNHHKTYDVGTWKQVARQDGFENIVFLYGCDEPHFFPVYGDDYNNWLICNRYLREAQAAWPEAPRMVTAHIQSAEHNNGTALTDIMVINVELLDGPPGGPWFAGDQRPLYDAFLQNNMGRPKELWLYAACGSHGCVQNNDPYTNGWAGYEIDAPASESRAIAWLAFRYRLTGTLYYDMAMLLPNAWINQYYATGNGDGNMMYAGTTDRIGGTDPIPIESLRMKLVRDGYEDYEYLEQLRRLGYGHEAHEIARSLFPAPYDTARGDAQVQAARTRLAQRLAAILGGPTP